MMKITGLSRLFKWENLHNWWLTKYFFAPLYVMEGDSVTLNIDVRDSSSSSSPLLSLVTSTSEISHQPVHTYTTYI